jgi:hypothetical protein
MRYVEVSLKYCLYCENGNVYHMLLSAFRRLASGDSISSMGFSFQMHKSTARLAFYETCAAIWEALREEFVKVPTEDQWRTIADEFNEFWQFPRCLGALDGKHITIQVSISFIRLCTPCF